MINLFTYENKVQDYESNLNDYDKNCNIDNNENKSDYMDYVANSMIGER